VGRLTHRRDQPEAEPAGHKIVPVYRTDMSGDTFLFTSYLSTGSQSAPGTQWNSEAGYGTTVAWPHVPGALSETGSLNVLHACESTPGRVAYNGISYLSQALDHNLGEAELENYVGQYTLPTAIPIQDSVSSFVSLTPPNETISLTRPFSTPPPPKGRTCSVPWQGS
jgi:phosphate transport system substrate-binding protein